MKNPYSGLGRAVLVAAALSSTSACYTFRPTSADELMVGQTVRARVSGVWADSLDAVIQRDARVFEATVVEDRGGALLMEIPIHLQGGPSTSGTLSQRVEIPDQAFVGLELKTLDRGRTGVTAGVVAIAVGALVLKQLSGKSGGEPDFGGPGPTESVLSSLLDLLWR